MRTVPLPPLANPPSSPISPTEFVTTEFAGVFKVVKLFVGYPVLKSVSRLSDSVFIAASPRFKEREEQFELVLIEQISRLAGYAFASLQ
jgi:hypothetical protein